MDKLNELVELANKMGGESWRYTQSSIFSKGYITGRGGRTIVQTYNGDVPANACQFIRTADPAAILEIAKAFRALEQRAEEAEAALELESDIHIDTAASMREWRLRAEAAEAQLAGLAKQESRDVFTCTGCGHSVFDEHPSSCDCGEGEGYIKSESFTRPALAAVPVVYRWWFVTNPAQVNVTIADMIDALIRKPGMIVEGLAPVTREEYPLVTKQEPVKELTGCMAGKDGECYHRLCPQNRDNEPEATGRHCPLDTQEDDE